MRRSNRRDVMTIRISLVLLILAAIAGACTDSGGRLPGDRLTVIDGDTVEWRGGTYDLAGLDAPELGQRCLNGTRLYPCGIDAAAELAKRAALDEVHCSLTGEGTLSCRVGDETLAEQQVAGGWAYALHGASGELAGAAEQAKSASLGVWRGTHVAPSKWRRGVRLPEEESNSEPCPILAMTIRGWKVYVGPLDPNYDTYRDSGGAERFCSDEEARDAGYRHIRTERSED